MSNQTAVSVPGNFRTYLQGVGASSLAMGLQVVLFPWLVVGVLGESADRVGYAQMAVMLPNLIFILLGGAISDNRHIGVHLFRLYLLYSLPFSALIAMVFLDQLSYGLVLVFGVSFGLISAFVQPARESLLAQVADRQLQDSVARASLVQFAAQGVGIICAGYLDKIGLITLASCQIVLFVISGLLLKKSYGTRQFSPAPRSSALADIRSGLKVVWNDRRLFHLMVVVAATGFLGFGLYLVAIPLLTREVYQQGAVFFACLQLSFTLGVVASNIVVIRQFGRFSQPGRTLLVSLFIRGCFLLLIATHLPVWLLFPLVFLWGAFSGVSMMLGRAMTHEEAPEKFRARVVSVYQLALFGAAPIGAWVSGQTIEQLGVLPAIGLLGGLTLVAAIVAIFFSRLWTKV